MAAHAEGDDRRLALVTGAARGIGRAIAVELARQGTDLILLVRTSGQAEETRKLVEERGARARVVDCDLSDSGAVRAIELGPVDVLVHNAAAYAAYARIEESHADAERDVLHVALTAGLELARKVLPGMRARGFGRLIFVGSAAAGLGAGGQAAYAAAKAGYVGLARSLAVEAGLDGVTCNVVEPGLIDTERIRSVLEPRMLTQIQAGSAVGRSGRPEEVAALVEFLASERAGFVTGAVIPIDGGLGLGVVPNHTRTNGRER